MNANANVERKVVRNLAKFLADEQVLVSRWSMVGKALTFLGSLLWVLAIFAFAQDSSVSWVIAAISAVGGVCIGLGLWFSTFVTQWPVVRQFIDAERVRQRSIEIDDQDTN
jgi:hypothetical protein